MTSRGALEKEKPDTHTQIVLGKQLKNPYSIENMQRAFDYYNAHVSESSFRKKKVEATHYYIKVTPTNEKQLELLDELDNSDNINAPVLQDYPLDYEIKQEGDYYVMPKDEKDLYHPSYTTIPVGYRLPNNIPYEIIDKIYKPSEKEFDVETVALVFANWQDDLKAQFDTEIHEKDLPRLLKLWKEYEQGELTQQEFQSRGWFSSLWNSLFGRKFRPKGKVEVVVSDTGVPESLMKAKISIGRGFWWRYTYTDNGGNFTSPKKYRGKVKIRAKWRGYTATIRKSWNELLGLWVSDYLMSMKRNSNKTKTIYYSHTYSWFGSFNITTTVGHLWTKATIHNGLRKYVDYCNNHGINRSTRYANVWAWSNGSGDASTPMLYKFRNLPALSTVAGIGQADYWHVLVNQFGGIGIGLTPSWLRPDHIFTGLKKKKAGSIQSSSIRIHQTVFHESGHYSHASKAGQWYWAKVFSSEMSNFAISWALPHQGADPYLDGSSPSYQAGKRIALAEGFGNLTEFKVTQHYYKKSMINGYWAGNIGYYSVDNQMDRFNMHTTPMTIKERKDTESWFLHGVMWDILDGAESKNTNLKDGQTDDNMNSISDRVYINSTNNLYPIFRCLTSSVHHGTDLKNKLIITLTKLIILTNYLHLMDIRKIVYALGVFCILSLLQSCPDGYKDCNERIGYDVPNLVYITPLQATYQQGDEVVLKLFINAGESYFGERNIYERTGDETAEFRLGSSVLFTDNELTFIKGSQGTRPHFFNMPYNSVTGEYELEVKIKLNRTGTYTQSASLYIYITGDGHCDTFDLKTNIAGINEEGNIEFEVLP